MNLCFKTHNWQSVEHLTVSTHPLTCSNMNRVEFQNSISPWWYFAFHPFPLFAVQSCLTTHYHFLDQLYAAVKLFQISQSFVDAFTTPRLAGIHFYNEMKSCFYDATFQSKSVLFRISTQPLLQISRWAGRIIRLHIKCLDLDSTPMVNWSWRAGCILF